MQWEIVIGIETHAQLTTASKIFSGSSTAFGAEPNSQASAIDLALPGTLPVLNRGAVERAIRFGIAIGAKVARHSIFARKNYFYPDLPKGYQISQYEMPVVKGGTLTFVVQPKAGAAYIKTVKLTRAHLEEDAGKSLHGYSEDDYVEPGYIEGTPSGKSGIDLNRAGVPLLEIVSEPEMRSAAEAVAYARAMHALVIWLDVCDGNMQEGSFRCDANVSVRPAGELQLGTRCEIKNLNSFRFLERAIEFEARRQIELIEDGGTVVQETRLYDPERDETRPLRSKEDAMDYRYFPDPDLLPVAIASDWIEQVRRSLPELPGAMRERFEREYGLPEYDASVLTASKAMATYYEAVARAVPDKKVAANWVMGEVTASLNDSSRDFASCPVSPGHLAGILIRLLDGSINAKKAKEVFAELWAKGEAGSFDIGGGFNVEVQLTGSVMVALQGDIDAIIEARGLKQISDIDAIEKIVDQVLAANAKSVDEYRAGKEKAFNALVGQAMKASRGQANPQQVNEIMRRKLEG
ncbi:MAG TPA: Asp-tRNA(Asn)/Glu-tRNA(Gln) amidotransferase subunit GatB [Burkholderiaceae bacterium]|nr:Asp-tRNA(Asn)/Glu-tRNA(Gln) amidotransferase subunit GatB [Burkholderiaceae bacterium]